jgi:hypothetical protein
MVALKAIGLFIGKIPWQLWAFLGVIVGCWWFLDSAYDKGYEKGEAAVTAKWNKETEERKEAEAKLLAEREAENAKLKATHDEIVKKIGAKHRAEVATLRADIKYLDELRLGPSWNCPAPTTTEADSAGGGHGTGSPARVVPPAARESLEELIYEAEHASLVARSCQQFIIENGMAPAQ